MDDIQYYRKELAFKADKGDIEGYRQEYVERISQMEVRIG